VSRLVIYDEFCTKILNIFLKSLFKSVLFESHFVTLHCNYTVSRKKAYSIVCVTLTILNIFSQFLVQIILRLHFTKILENLPHILAYHYVVLM